MSDSRPPFGPPAGPPPQGPPPPSDEVSYGWSEPPEPQRGSRRRWLLMGAGVVAAGAIVAGAAFGAASVLGGTKKPSGPATALPASTFAFASIDTDPADGQIGDLLGILAKFPGFTKQLSLQGSGAGTSTDPRQLVFNAIAKSRGGLGSCHLSWNDDLAPWLGNQFAIAGVPVDNKPQPVAVAQVTDTSKASAEVTKLQGCDHADSYALSGDWLLVAPQRSAIDAVTKGVSAGTLADDPTYQHWMGEIGDAGIVQAYAAPSAGAMMAATLTNGAAGAAGAAGVPGSSSQMLGGMCPGAAGGGSAASSQAALRGFRGGAATVRVRDGGIETESAVDMGSSAGSAVPGSGAAGTGSGAATLVTSLPADTSAAVGLSMGTHPWESILSRLSSMCGGSLGAGQIDSYLGGLTGLNLPGDIDTLLGNGLALSVGPLDMSTLDRVGSDPSALPVALQFSGDAGAIQGVVHKVLDKIGQAAGVPVGSVIGVDANGNRVAVGPSSTYRKAVLGNGGLGADPTFQNAVPDASKASSIFYVDLDRFDPLVKSASASAYKDYFAPLQAVGVAGWGDSDHVSHSLMRVTTD